MAWPQEERGIQKNDGGEAVRHAIGVILNGGLEWFGRVWSRHGHVLGATLMCGFLAGVMLIGWLRPDRNWDMLAYIAAAWQPDYPLAADLHDKVFETLRAGVDPAEFEALTTGDAWRVRQATDPDAFVSMIGMYDVKWLYVELLKIVMPFSGPIKAGLVINTFAAGMFGVVLTWWLAAKRMLNYTPLIIAGLVVLGLPSMAIAKTPDMFTTVLVVSGFLLLERDWQRFGIAVLVAAVLVRPDSAAIAGVLMAAAWFWRDRITAATILGFAGAAAAYLFVSNAGHHPGWWPHLWFSTFHMQETMHGFAPDMSVRVYVTAFFWNIVRSIFEDTWLAVYALITIVFGVLRARRTSFHPRSAMLLMAALTAIAAKFVIFPLHDGRTYLPLLIPAGLLLLAGWRQATADTSASGQK